MKLLYTLLILLLTATGFAQCLNQDFTNLSLGSYTNGTFELDGLVWSGIEVIQESSGNSVGGTGKSLRINDDKAGANVTLPILDAPKSISFQYRELNSGGGTFIIQKSIDGGGTFTDVCTQTYSGNTYQSYTCDINETATGVYLRILSDNNPGHLIIDNVSVDCTSSNTCSISNIQIDSSCNGNDAELVVEFTTANTSGSFEYTLDGGTSYSPISKGGTILIGGPTDAVTKTIEIRDTNDTNCSSSTTFEVPICDNSIATTSNHILITEIADPSDEYQNRYVKICNRGAETVNISGWVLKNYFNGIDGTDPNDQPLESTIRDGAVLAPGECYVMMHGDNNYTNLTCSDSKIQDAFNVTGNGNDVFELSDSNGVPIDVYGVIGVDGTGENWEYKDKTATRLTSVSTATTLFNINEWTIAAATSADLEPCSEDDALQIYNDIVGDCSPTSSTAISGNQFQFVKVNNKVIAAINPMGGDLGIVTGSVYIRTNTLMDGEGVSYLNRTIFLSPEYNNVPAIVRYYFTQEELNQLIADSKTVNTDLIDDIDGIDDLYVTQIYGASCDSTFLGNVDGSVADGQLHNPTDANFVVGEDIVGLYLEFQVGEFSAFTAHGGIGQLLPVELTTFTANEQNGEVVLKWATASEINNKEFEVRRSADGLYFETIGKVQGAGTTSVSSEYSFIDAFPLAGVNYYQLNTIDFNGDIAQSKIINVDVQARQNAIIASNRNEITVYTTVQGPTQLSIYNLQGQLIKRQEIEINQRKQTIHFKLPLAPGVYVIKMQQQNNKTVVEKFIIN